MVQVEGIRIFNFTKSINFQGWSKLTRQPQLGLLSSPITRASIRLSYARKRIGSHMTFTTDADEVFYYLHGLDQKSDILDLLPMAA
jgi:hypothetical protein